MADIQNYNRGAAEKYFMDNYGPANLTCVVVGDC